MGKGNRVRLAKAQSAAESQSVFTAKKQKKQTPAWVSTLIVVLVIVLLVSCVALSVVSEGGYTLRWAEAVESDNFTVTGTMLSYYFYQNYSTFLNQYGDIVSYMGLDTSKSLKSQTAMGAEEGQTWFDYFMEPAVEQAKVMLVYCEEAKARGIKLEDEDYKLIDESLELLEQAAAEYGYTAAGYISAMYGTGVKESDVRAALELSQLATKCSEIFADEVNAGITDAEIDTYYSENIGTFLTADILYYDFITAKGDKDDATYKADIEEITKKAEELAACKTDEEFKEYILNYEAGDAFDGLYESASESLAETLLPDEATLAARRQQIIDACIANALEGKAASKTESTDEVEKMFSEIEVDLTDALAETLLTVVYDGYVWTDAEADEAGLWISDAERKVGDTTVIGVDNTAEATDDAAAGYTATTYRIVSTMSRDETPARDVGHILFTATTYETDTAAEAKAEEIMAQFKAGTMSKETFEALAKEYTEDSGVFYENVIPGQMVAEFENWLFDEARADGDVGIVETQYGYHIMYYMGENADMPAWKASAKGAIATERTDAWYEENSEKYNVSFDEKVADKINA